MNGNVFKRVICFVTLVAFVVMSVPSSYAQSVVSMPAPGTMVALSEAFQPPVLKGIKVYPDNPFRFDFILDKGNTQDSTDQLREESSRLIKYFMASLTVPEKDLWVNLSPYEKDRIVPEAFGQTEMGRDLLAQDYLLKQITASVIYPEGETGKKFWEKVYRAADEKYGTSDIPFNTFNKVWIVPEEAVVYENSSTATAYVVNSRLKVMLETDYKAIENSVIEGASESSSSEVQDLTKTIVREVVIPVLEKEVNEGENFAKLRQVYQSMILAAWYKKKVKESLLAKEYVDQKKVDGINIGDPQEAEKIWARYVEAFKKGVFNYIKEEKDAASDEILPRKYFSGGVDCSQFSDLVMTITYDAGILKDAAMVSQEKVFLIATDILRTGLAPWTIFQKIGNHTPHFGSPLRYLIHRFGLKDVNEALVLAGGRQIREPIYEFLVSAPVRKLLVDKEALFKIAKDVRTAWFASVESVDLPLAASLMNTIPPAKVIDGLRRMAPKLEEQLSKFVDFFVKTPRMAGKWDDFVAAVEGISASGDSKNYLVLGIVKAMPLMANMEPSKVVQDLQMMASKMPFFHERDMSAGRANFYH